jgi:transposase
MWTTENRPRYNQDKLRYPSDVMDDEWALCEPMIPPAKHGGRNRTVNIREIFNGALYVLSTGCQWRATPKDIVPKSTVHGYFLGWQYDGTLSKLHHVLYMKCREQAEREASPTAWVTDSQSVKGSEKRGPRLIRRDMMLARRSTARRALIASGAQPWSTR